MAQLERPAAASAGPRPVVSAIGEIQPQDRVAVTGVIRAFAALSIGGCPACRYTLADATGEVDLMFLGRIAIRGLEQGWRCGARGTAAARDGRMVIWNPRYQLYPADAAGQRRGIQDHSRHDDHPRRAADRVLVATGDRSIRSALKANLEARGFRVDLAATGSAAMARTARSPDVIILDLDLPDVTGAGTVRLIRSRCDAKIIVITGQGSATVPAADADDHLGKPFRIDTLLGRIRAVQLPWAQAAGVAAVRPGTR